MDIKKKIRFVLDFCFKFRFVISNKLILIKETNAKINLQGLIKRVTAKKRRF